MEFFLEMCEIYIYNKITNQTRLENGECTSKTYNMGGSERQLSTKGILHNCEVYLQ